MMRTLRKYMKHILWIVALAFVATIIFSWGMGGFKRRSQAAKGIIGVVNGQKISYQQFFTLMDQEIENTKKQSGTDELSEYQRQAIRDRVWQTLVRNILFAQEVKRLKIKASPEEIVFQLRNNPPDVIKSNKQFQTDGKFDMSKYQQALSDPRNYNAWIPLENYFRNNLPIQKLQQNIIATVRVTDSEVREAYRLENERVNVKYIFFDPSKVSMENINVSDSEISTYYKEHRKDYREPEKRKIQYVLFKNIPSSDDSMQTQRDAQDILKQLRNGADFEELAKEYSDDKGTASKGGDLGFFGKGEMVKPFEKAVFSARVGEIVGPVKTQFGLHIIQVLARKTEKGKTKVHARHILLKYKTSPETYDAINEKAQYFYDEVKRTKGKKFNELAKEEGLTVKETPLFQKGGFIPGIGMVPRITYFAFQQRIGWVSQPITTSGEDIIIFRISAIQKPHYKSLKEVKSSILNILQMDKKKKRTGKICMQVWEKINHGMSFEEAAQKDSLKIMETGLFKLQSYLPGIGMDPHFNGAAFKLKVGEVSKPVEGNRGYYLIKLINHTKLNEKIFEAEKNKKKQELLQQKMQMAYIAWFNSLKEKANIKDYRDQYF